MHLPQQGQEIANEPLLQQKAYILWTSYLVSSSPASRAARSRTRQRWTNFWAFFCSTALSAYLFSLPWLASYYNAEYHREPEHHAAYLGTVCGLSPFTPGLRCLNRDRLRKLARAQNRTWVCGCTQGPFGEAICPLGAPFSVSYFISSVTATGLLYSLAWWPCRNTWWYAEWLEHTFQPPPLLGTISFFGLLGYQVFFGLMLCMPSCLWLSGHVAAVGVMSWSFAAFAISTTITLWRERQYRALKVVILLVLIGMLGFVFMTLASCLGCKWEWVPHVVCTYFFWFGESMLLSAMAFMAPCLMIFGGVDLPIVKQPALSQE